MLEGQVAGCKLYSTVRAACRPLIRLGSALVLRYALPMLIPLLALAQAAATDHTPPSRASGPAAVSARCQGGTDAAGEIIVCGRGDTEAYRLRPVPDRWHPNTGLGLGFMLGDVKGNAYVAQEATPDGKPDKRIMVTLTKPF